MPAMTMEFVVLERDAPLLREVAPGDVITATLVAPDTRYWIQDITHYLRTAVLDPRRRLFHLHTGNDWKPAELVADPKAAAGG